jgi:hypothetical protein
VAVPLRLRQDEATLGRQSTKRNHTELWLPIASRQAWNVRDDGVPHVGRNETTLFQSELGGRGITVCAQWLGEDGFVNFFQDVGRKPSPELTLDRINVNGNYEPGNVRWADAVTQANNRRPPGPRTADDALAEAAGFGT